PSITNLVPSDIEIRQNYIFKQPSWRGASWSVKNLLELKNAQRVLIDGNLLENNWANAQNGFGVLFTVRNQDGTAPWSTVRDVTFSNNIVRHTGAAVNILATDNLHPSQQTQRVQIKNNLFDDVSTAWGGNGTFLQVMDGGTGPWPVCRPSSRPITTPRRRPPPSASSILPAATTRSPREVSTSAREPTARTSASTSPRWRRPWPGPGPQIPHRRPPRPPRRPPRRLRLQPQLRHRPQRRRPLPAAGRPCRGPTSAPPPR